jgi:hypothetical protein
MSWQRVSSALRSLLSLRGAEAFVFEFWAVFGPGGRLHPAAFIESKGHLVLEGLLVAIIAYLLFQRSSYKPKTAAAAPLTEKVRLSGRPAHLIFLGFRARTYTLNPMALWLPCPSAI